MSDSARFCASLDEWAALMIAAAEPGDTFAQSWQSVRLQISKSCLLDRVLYGGEKPSKTPCPVHKGKWSGCHFAWPGAQWTNVKTGERTPAEVDATLQQWLDDGCRCAMHKGCGCTTGWQPDENCGCIATTGGAAA